MKIKSQIPKLLLLSNIIGLIVCLFFVERGCKLIILWILAIEIFFLTFFKNKIISCIVLLAVLMFNYLSFSKEDVMYYYFGHIEKITYNENRKQNEITSESIKSLENADLNTIQMLYYHYEPHKKFYDKEFYYQLCLFFENNKCNPYLDHFAEELKRNELSIKRKRKQDNDIQPFYNKFFIIPKEHLDYIVYGYPVFMEENLHKIEDKSIECTMLFYGAQNGWIKYKEKLITKLKSEDGINCINNILYNINIDNVQNNEYRRSLLLFLKNKK